MNTGNFYYNNFVVRGCKVIGRDDGYVVVATQQYKSGQIIEECITKPISSTLESFYTNDDSKDNKLLDGLVTTHNPVTGKTAMHMVGGNFIHYGFYPINNATYQHDHRFAVVTIRAIKDINIGEEITFYPILPEENETPMPQKTKKSGCGCGKNSSVDKTANLMPSMPIENYNETLNSLSTQHFGAPKILRDKTQNLIKNNEFKSMVNNKALDSIKVDK